MVTLEQIFDKIADAIMLDIEQFTDNPQVTLQQNQKTIRNGIIQLGIESLNDNLLLFQTDAEANEEDNVSEIVNIVNNLNTFYDINGDLIPDGGIIASVSITITGGGAPDFAPTINIQDTNGALGGGV